MSKLKEEGLKINYYPIDSAIAMETLEAITEGMVLANMVELEHGAPDLQGLVQEGIRYEYPQEDCARDQRVGTISAILHKGRATCIEAAAVAAAVERRAGNDAYVHFDHQRDAYDKPIPWKYHAYMMLNGQLTDPSAALAGSPQAGGPCCGSCAIGEPCEDDCDEHVHVGAACCDSCAEGKTCESECAGHPKAAGSTLDFDAFESRRHIMMMGKRKGRRRR